MHQKNNHQAIVFELDKLQANTDLKTRLWVAHYLGTNKPTRCIKISEIKKLARKYAQDVDLIDSLYRHGSTFDELAVAASMVKSVKVNISDIDKWLNFCVGWAEVDSLCQSNFTADKVVPIWSQWKKFLTRLSTDENINKRRASLVLMCKTLGQSDNIEVSDFAFKTVDKLKHEKEVLITKAISWVLRQQVKYHSAKLADYLAKNKGSLPKIAYREAMKKPVTGKKN